MTDPTSPVRGDSSNRAIVDTENKSGPLVRAEVMVLATAEDGDVARPSGTDERPLVVKLGEGGSSRPNAVEVVHMDGVSIAGSVPVLEADPLRRALTVRNASDTKMTLRVSSPDAGPTDYPLDPGRGYEFPANMIPAGAVSLYCTVADKAWNVMVVTDA